MGIMQGLGLTPGPNLKLVLAPWLRVRIDSNGDRGTPWEEWTDPDKVKQYPACRQKEGPRGRVNFVAHPESYVWNDGAHSSSDAVRDAWSNPERKEKITWD